MKIFDKLLVIINEDVSFEASKTKIQAFIDSLTLAEVIEMIENIGIIPECIEASSSAEKKYSKASDMMVARAFQELNFKAKAITERGNAADVVVESVERSYSFVSDAKSFRLSRTAKNQKDYKVDSLSKWRGSNDYAVLIAPYFQYPTVSSQIFEQSLLENVLLFSWEHLALLLRKSIKETEHVSLEQIWNFPMKFKKRIPVSDLQNNFLHEFNTYFMSEIKLDLIETKTLMKEQVDSIKRRAASEAMYLKGIEFEIRLYDKEKAIMELINSRKILQRQNAIHQFMGGLDDAINKYFETPSSDQ